MNLSNYAKVTVVYQSTNFGSTANLTGTTGDAVTLSTGFATGTSSGQTVGGYPFASTGIDTSDFEGCVFIANFNSNSTGGGAGTSGIATLYAFGVPSPASATALSTTYSPLQGASVSGYSTASITLVLDVYRPKARFLQAQAQTASSSQVLNSIIAIQYGAKKEATANTTTIGSPALGGVVAGTVLSISPGT